MLMSTIMNDSFLRKIHNYNQTMEGHLEDMLVPDFSKIVNKSIPEKIIGNF